MSTRKQDELEYVYHYYSGIKTQTSIGVVLYYDLYPIKRRISDVGRNFERGVTSTCK